SRSPSVAREGAAWTSRSSAWTSSIRFSCRVTTSCSGTSAGSGRPLARTAPPRATPTRRRNRRRRRRRRSSMPASTRQGSHQAAEDLESIRDHLGLARFALYGESYGTELAQAYAASHPDRLSALVLDGAVDLTMPANEFWAAAAKGFDRTLEDTFAACLSDD